MNTVNKMSKTVAKTMGKSADRLLKHKYLNLLVVLLIALYAGMAAPVLPNFIITAVDSTVGKLVFLFLIGYVASKNIQVALMVAVAFVVTLHVANSRATERFISLRTAERFAAGDECTEDSDCGGNKCLDTGICESFTTHTCSIDGKTNQVDCEAATDAAGNPGKWEAAPATAQTSDPATGTGFANFDPTAQTFSNFEGFWAGAEGAGETEGFDQCEEACEDDHTPHADVDECKAACPAAAADDVQACKVACGGDEACETACETFVNAPEEFSVYPDSGSKYAYSLF